MLLREAVALCRSAKLSPTRRLALVCSFEPLHLKTYLQARCAARFPEAAPECVSFGFDQLARGLESTGAELGAAPAALVLSWDDIHPALSWRGRAALGPVGAEEIAARGRDLAGRIAAWVRSRPGVSVVVLPPRSWLPALDPVPPSGLGPLGAAAGAAAWEAAAAAVAAGARLLESGSGLNYRDLLLAGHPIPTDQDDALAALVVDAVFPPLPRRKALVVDLDGTLWHGTIGEDGPEGVSARDEGAGHAFFVFQRLLLRLRREGVLLAFCSKNNPGDVLPVFDALDMPLKLSDFAARRCDWDPKSGHLRAIAAELNIGTDSLVFVDDNEVELAEVRAALPETAALAVPRDGPGWLALFERLQALFGAWRLADEDRLRADSVARPAPPAAEGSSGAGHLKDLGLRLTVNREAFADLRSLELVNKTNQFNLNGRRLAEDEWLALAAEDGAFCWSAKVSDRFGDFGTVCVVVGAARPDGTELRQFVLSCRAFGRCVEALVLGELAQAFPGPLRGAFFDTGKNEPARRFLESLGCRPAPDGRWSLERETALAAAAQAARESGAVVQTPAGGAR
ncbi:MAG: HAD-IIIC family phosphatase [Elusimicrobia bacterium]|nr:HAD-IIIC family phosphatase [Elusimicrobiota bacterium]